MSQEIDQQVLKSFIKNFKNPIIIKSPGLINLIGEHIDYHVGFVLPAAIDKCITLQLQKNNTSSSVNIYNKTFESFATFDINELKEKSSNWINYIKGVIYFIEIIRPNGIETGFDIIIESDLPMGSGLSSSAALECGIGKALDELFNLNINPIEMVKLCQKAEHEFAATNCGIMDQFSIYMSKKNHFTLLNCDTLEYKLVS